MSKLQFFKSLSDRERMTMHLGFYWGSAFGGLVVGLVFGVFA